MWGRTGRETVVSLKGLFCELIWTEPDSHRLINLPTSTLTATGETTQQWRCSEVCRGRMDRVTIKPQPSLHGQNYALQDPGQARIMRKKQREHRLVQKQKWNSSFPSFPSFQLCKCKQNQRVYKKNIFIRNMIQKMLQ